MPTPSFSKTWQHTFSGGNSTNVRLVSSGTTLTDYQTAMLRIKNILTGFTNVPWTTRYSCNSVTAGAAGDGVDRWATIANLVFNNAGSAHSWYVLRQTGVGATFEVCIDLSAIGGSSATVVMSPSAGFTGGSTTARPTATDEVVLCNNTTWLGGGGSAFTGVLSVMQSTDGACTRLVFFRAGFIEALWVIDKPNGPVTGWANPVFGAVSASSGASIVTYSNWINTTTPKGFVRIGTTNGGAGMTTDDYFSSTQQVGQRQLSLGDVSGEYVMTPCGIAVPTTVGARGRHGSFFDLWAVPTSLRVGETAPNDTTRTFLLAGCFALPWNGEQPKVN